MENHFCKTCNMMICYMTITDHNDTNKHKQHALNPVINIANDSIYCKYCDKNFAHKSVYSHNKSVYHMIAVKKSNKELILKYKDYLCKICNTEVKWRNLYDHEKEHGMHKRSSIYHSSRFKTYCGLCEIDVYRWDRHQITDSHIAREKLYNMSHP